MKSGTRTRQLRDPPARNSDGPVTQSPFETRRFRWRRISAIARISASRERTRSVGEVIQAHVPTTAVQGSARLFIVAATERTHSLLSFVY